MARTTEQMMLTVGLWEYTATVARDLEEKATTATAIAA
jgi:hypothetical protein